MLDDLIRRLEYSDHMTNYDALDKEIYGHFDSQRMLASYTTSTDAALDFMNNEVSRIRILNLVDDGQACGAELWVYPNGLSNGNEFLVKGIQQCFAVAICIVTLKAVRILRERNNEK